jgi:protein gp37
MALSTAIEWTDATWNPVTGCTKISPGCDRCYAERFANRFRGVVGHPFEQGFDLQVRPERLEQPLSWRAPRMVFVNSMSDLFHKGISDQFVDKVFDTMEAAHWHRFQVLTKRSSRLARYTTKRYAAGTPPSNVWLGVSVEDGQRKGRVAQLKGATAAVRFLSVEPLIGPVGSVDLSGIDWVIVGGESGPGFRPLAPAWVAEMRDQCVQQGVPFFFKQWGGLRPKSNGRMLDGREWNQFPGQQMSKALQQKRRA